MSNGIKIPFSKPFIPESIVSKVTEVINSGWWTTGSIGEEFEKEFASYVGAKYCVLVSSGTAALFLAVKRELEKNPHIKSAYLPSFTFAATATAAIHNGLKLNFGDIEKTNYCLLRNSEWNELAIPVHLTGNTAYSDYPYVVEDSAHKIQRDQCKGVNHSVCFSFYATKNLAMGEGGAICTNSEEDYWWLKQARHHGISKGGWNRYREGGSHKHSIDFIGWKFNQSDVLAAIGLEQLKYLDEMNTRRNEIVKMYNKKLGLSQTGNHVYMIQVDERDDFIEEMKEAGIQCAVHFQPLHQIESFKQYIDDEKSLPVTDYLGSRVVSIPLYPTLKDEEIKYICQTIKKLS